MSRFDAYRDAFSSARFVGISIEHQLNFFKLNRAVGERGSAVLVAVGTTLTQ
jgi:hypothetical protein